jgi:hypothetical protein
MEHVPPYTTSGLVLDNGALLMQMGALDSPLLGHDSVRNIVLPAMRNQGLTSWIATPTSGAYLITSRRFMIAESYLFLNLLT